MAKGILKNIVIVKNKYVRLTAKKGVSGIYFFVDRLKKQFDTIADGTIANDSVCDQQIEYETLIKPKSEKTKKKHRFTWLFLLINIGVVVGIFFFQFSKGGIKPLSELFAENPYYRFLFLALGIFVFVNILEILKFLFLIYKANRQWMPWVAIKLAIYGKYWDCVTPFSTGGQPFQIYELRKNKFSGDVATGIPLSKYLFWQIAFTALALVVFITPITAINSTEANVVKYAAMVGFSANIILFVLNLLMSTNRKVAEKIILGCVKIGVKLKIVKNPISTMRRSIIFVDNYQKCIKNFVSSAGVFIVQTVLALAGILAQFSVAYCVYLAFNFPDFMIHSWFEVVALALLCEQAISFVPLPGGAAAAEVSFVAMFSALFAARGVGVVFWAMLVWRFCTYYLFIIQGLIVMFIDSFIKKRKAKKPQTLNVLQEE